MCAKKMIAMTVLCVFSLGALVASPGNAYARLGAQGKEQTSVQERGKVEQIAVEKNEVDVYYKVYGYAYVSPPRDSNAYLPFIGGEVVVLDPSSLEILEATGAVTDHEGYFEFYKPAGWSGDLGVYRPANNTVLLTWGFPPRPYQVDPLVSDCRVFSSELLNPPGEIWLLGGVNMIPHITGFVTTSSGEPVEDVRVYYQYAGSYQDYTDEKGEYLITYEIFGLENIIHLAEYGDAVFLPESRTYPVVNRDALDQSFIMLADDEVGVHGTVSDADGVPLADIPILLDDIMVTTTNANGEYWIVSQTPLSGVVKPSEAVYAFVPQERTYTDLTEPLSDQDFVGYQSGAVVTQQIVLQEGWNVISFNVDTYPIDMLSIVQPLMSSGVLIIMQDDGIGVIWPEYNIATIGDMSVTEGYKINVTQDTMLEVSGVPVALPVAMPLNEGWNTIGWPAQTSQNALSVVVPLITNNTLIEVIDENAAKIYYNGSTWINDIGSFEPGEGYHIKVTENTAFVIS